MMSKEEREYRERKRFAEKFIETYKQLTPWHKFEVYLFLNWLYLRHRIRTLPIRWVEFQLKLERDIEIHGMPYQLKRQLEKWFNYPPHKDNKYFLIQGKKIWYHCYIEKDYFELHLYYKQQFPGHIWFEIKEDGTASIVGIGITDRFRNMGLGTLAFQTSIKQIEDRITNITGVLEKEYYPDPTASLRWLQRQGFEVHEQENGDYKIELRLKL